MNTILHEAEQLASAVLARDLEGRPLYLVAASAADWPIHPTCGGFTHLGLDLLVQNHLEETGRWKGRGAAAIINDRQLDDYEIILTALHEAGHMPPFIAGIRD